MKEFIENEYNIMWNRFKDNIIKMQALEFDEAKFCMCTVMLATLYESWQRPGAVTNLKVKEFDEGTETDGI